MDKWMFVRWPRYISLSASEVPMFNYNRYFDTITSNNSSLFQYNNYGGLSRSLFVLHSIHKVKTSSESLRKRWIAFKEKSGTWIDTYCRILNGICVCLGYVQITIIDKFWNIYIYIKAYKHIIWTIKYYQCYWYEMINKFPYNVFQRQCTVLKYPWLSFF